ncbi:MAG: DUF2723 domain-containing protein [Muribaculum sp.]|nr:DUF2723 domain-containing protein [Muribaculum sp.]
MKTVRYLTSSSGALRKALNDPSAVYRGGSLLVFLCALVTYWLTVDSSVSFWDCPEYVVTAYRLEIGHSPGNPTWSLAHNVVAHLAASVAGVENVALGINLAAGLFTALAMMLLYQTCFFAIRYVLRGRPESSPLFASIASLGGALSLTWADSPWFSAVEAEVYAMSLFFTALTIKVMIMFCRSADTSRRSRLLILEAFLIGLSIGVHELNLLAIPALILIWIFDRYRHRCALKAWAALLLSVAIVASLLLGMYPGITMLAGLFELCAVNSLDLPFNAGVLSYLALLLLLVVAAPLSLTYGRPAGGWKRIPLFAVRSLCCAGLLFTGGFFLLGSHIAAAACLAAAAGVILAVGKERGLASPALIMWMASACIVGFSSYLLIPVRGAANPPVNENAPTNVFSLYSYLKRDQYGSRPLLYGSTPYAKPLYHEKTDSTGKTYYADYVRIPKRPVYLPARPSARLHEGFGLIDSLQKKKNDIRIAEAAKGIDRYVMASVSHDLRYPPELDMWFPRLTSHDKFDISNYEVWAGMTKDNMTEVEVSYAVDSAGNPVGKRGDDGSRSKEKSYRPTYLQNLRELFGYQIGYMYFRYLLWNFSGRQNDYPSAGELDHGNFITGIRPVDNLMLTSQEQMPPELSSSNPGRNPYFMLPFVLGIAGGVAAMARGRRGKRFDAVVFTLFLMTGVAIVVYLNQDPGEPRERDYSFMGSFYAFAIWIAMGCSWLLSLALRIRRSRCLRRLCAALAIALTLGSPLWMLAVNYADHDRSGRHAATDFTFNLLESLEPNAIVFVDGDNFTFPLWYAQEVLGLRRDVTVVSVTYLTTGWYVAQLQRPGEQARPVAMTAREQDVAYNAFSFARLGRSSLDSVSADAVAELRRLFNTPQGEVPRFNAGLLRIQAGSDSVVIDLHKVSGGSSNLNQRWLAMLDIVATNAASPEPRPVYWHSALVPSQHAGFHPYTSQALYARKLTLAKSPQDSTAYLLDEAMRFLPKLKAGGADTEGVYFDPYVGEHVSRQRIALLQLAEALLRAGKPREALKVTLTCLEKFPAAVWPYQGKVIRNGVVWQEGLKLAELMKQAAMLTSDTAARQKAERLHKSETARIRKFQSWRESLPEWRRATLSKDTRRIKLPVEKPKESGPQGK